MFLLVKRGWKALLDVISCLFRFSFPSSDFFGLTRRLLYFLDFYSIFQKFRKIILYVLYSTLIKSIRNSKGCTCSSWSRDLLPSTRNYTKYVHNVISNRPTRLLFAFFAASISVLLTDLASFLFSSGVTRWFRGLHMVMIVIETAMCLTVACLVFWYQRSFLDLNSAFIACLLWPLLFLFSDCGPLYALWSILSSFGLARFSSFDDSTASILSTLKDSNNLYLAVFFYIPGPGYLFL